MTNEQLTPTSTPTQKRKETKRKSNLFTVRQKIFSIEMFISLFQPGRKDEEKNKSDRLGHGRAIPIKQVRHENVFFIEIVDVFSSVFF